MITNSSDTLIGVTIGMCIRNSELTIKDAIESVLNQDFPHDCMELLIVDGYSTDKTLTLLKSILKNVDVKNKIFFENVGVGYARQVVVNNSKGKYIVWVDGDMILQRDFVRKQVEFMEKHPEVGIAKGKLLLVPTDSALGTLENFSRAASKMVDYQSPKAYSKVLGTSGCIYRTSAIVQVGGFDRDLKGYGEDWDAERKVRLAGWSLLTIDTKYLDYERYRLTWKALWSRYWRRGYDTHFFLHKNKGLLKHYRMFPPAAFLAGLLNAIKLFKITCQKLVFLLPFQCTLKMIAWYFGFLRAHFDSYQPKQISAIHQ